MQLRHFAWLGVTGFALLDTTYRYMDRVASGSPLRPWLQILVEQLTGTYGVLLLAPLAFRAVARHSAVGYLSFFLLFTLLHTCWNWSTRTILFPLFDFGPYNYGRMPERFLMEAPIDLAAFIIIVLLRRQYLAWQQTRQARAELLEARMQLLTRQLQPHFLFNSLNTVSSLMHEDVAKADTVLHRLSAFLRATTDLQNKPIIPLEQEFSLLNDYIAVMQARLEDKLDYRCRWDSDLASFPVPPLLLQPLVENAIEHGRTASGMVHVRVEASRRQAVVQIQISDQGPGFRTREGGFGLEAVRQRLNAIYGDTARLLLPDEANPNLRIELPLP